MTNIEKLISELNINQIDEVIGGSTTTVDGVVMSSGENDWITWTTKADGSKGWVVYYHILK